MRPSPIEDKRIFMYGLFSRDPCLFVKGFHPAPIAEFLKLYLSLNKLLVFIGIIITPLANAAAHRDQPVGMLNFGHGKDDTIFLVTLQRG